MVLSNLARGAVSAYYKRRQMATKPGGRYYAPFSSSREFTPFNLSQKLRYFGYGTKTVQQYQKQEQVYNQANYMKHLLSRVLREQLRRQNRYSYYAGLGKQLGERTLQRHGDFWRQRNAFSRKPSIIYPVKERPGWMQEKVPGFRYYYREGEYTPRYVIPRWSLPLRMELPGGGELPRAPGLPPRWVPWLLRLLPRYSERPTPPNESTTYNRWCRAYFINVYNGTTAWLPCSTPFPWKRISPLRQGDTRHKPLPKRPFYRRYRNRTPYYRGHRSRRYY